MAEELLMSVTGMAALATVSMATWTLAARYVEWDLVPRSALRRARFWQRHAQSFLVAAMVLTASGLAGVLVLAGT